MKKLIYLTIAFVIGFGAGIFAYTAQPKHVQNKLKWSGEDYKEYPIIIPNFSPDYSWEIIEF